MLSAIPPVMAMTLMVTAMAFASFEANRPTHAVVLTDSLIRHHKAVLDGASVGGTGLIADPDLTPFRPLKDWQSRYAVDGAGKTWLLTYATSLDDETGRIGPADLSAIPLELAGQDYRGAIYGLWAQNGTSAGYIHNTLFTVTGETDIPDNAPILASIVVPG